MASIEGITSLEGVGGFALISRSGQHWEMEEHPHSFVKICFTELAIRKKKLLRKSRQALAQLPSCGGVTVPGGVQETQRWGTDQ